LQPDQQLLFVVPGRLNVVLEFMSAQYCIESRSTIFRQSVPFKEAHTLSRWPRIIEKWVIVSTIDAYNALKAYCDCRHSTVEWRRCEL
jgi:hypothetical protein